VPVCVSLLFSRWVLDKLKKHEGEELFACMHDRLRTTAPLLQLQALLQWRITSCHGSLEIPRGMEETNASPRRASESRMRMEKRMTESICMGDQQCRGWCSLNPLYFSSFLDERP
jgi:hypothetical protein